MGFSHLLLLLIFSRSSRSPLNFGGPSAPHFISRRAAKERKTLLLNVETAAKIFLIVRSFTHSTAGLSAKYLASCLAAAVFGRFVFPPQHTPVELAAAKTERLISAQSRCQKRDKQSSFSLSFLKEEI
jgi:hypothetical protein